MLALLRADLFKTRKRPLGWAMLLIAMGLVALLMSIAGVNQLEQASFAFPMGLVIGAEMFSQLGGLMMIVFGATLVGSEYGFDTWKNLLTRHHQRTAFILSKWLVLFFAVILGLIVLPLWSQALGLLFNATLGLSNTLAAAPPMPMDQLLLQVGIRAIGPLVAGGIGFMSAVIGRSTVAGIVGGIVWSLADSILAALLNESLRFLTFNASNTSLMAHITGMPAPISLATSLVVVGCYLVAPVVVAALVFRWRDMAGN